MEDGGEKIAKKQNPVTECLLPDRPLLYISFPPELQESALKKKQKSCKQQVTTIKSYTAPAENPKCLWQDNVILVLEVILNVLFTGVNDSLLAVVVGGKET